MYIAVVPNRASPPAILLRESFREHGKVKNRTLANLSGWSSERIEALRAKLFEEFAAGKINKDVVEDTCRREAVGSFRKSEIVRSGRAETSERTVCSCSINPASYSRRICAAKSRRSVDSAPSA